MSRHPCLLDQSVNREAPCFAFRYPRELQVHLYGEVKGVVSNGKGKRLRKTASRALSVLREVRTLTLSRYFSPYPLSEPEVDDAGTPSAKGNHSATRIPGAPRTAFHTFGRTSDLLAGGAPRTSGTGHNATLWVCDKCFKYMAEGLSWELHLVRPSRFILTSA